MKLIFPTDQHYPYQDDRAIDVAMQIAEDFEPDVRISGSDGLDFYALSKFEKNPERIKTGLQDEIDQWQAGERAWNDATGNCKAHYLVGNHEDRLRRYMWRNPDLFSLRALELPNLLELDKFGIDYSNMEEFKFGGLLVKHGDFVRNHSAMSAKAELEKEFFSIQALLTGHTHRGGSFYVRTRNGLSYAFECFCLCKLDAEYVTHPNWQQGITLAEVKHGIVSIEQIPFHNYDTETTAVWRGKEYKS